MRKNFIEPGHPQLSVRRQAELAKVNRNRLTPAARQLSPDELELGAEEAQRVVRTIRDRRGGRARDSSR